MSNLKTLRLTPVELAVVALICCPLTCCLWPIVRDSSGPAGDPIPRQSPNEANRLHHPAGFSIVVPPNWGSHVTNRLESCPAVLFMAPLSAGRYARRSKALIVVSCIGNSRPSDLEGLQKTVFLGQEAYEGMRVVGKWTFDDGAWVGISFVPSA